jgi:hypothetical protein
MKRGLTPGEFSLEKGEGFREPKEGSGFNFVRARSHPPNIPAAPSVTLDRGPVEIPQSVGRAFILAAFPGHQAANSTVTQRRFSAAPDHAVSAAVISPPRRIFSALPRSTSGAAPDSRPPGQPITSSRSGPAPQIATTRAAVAPTSRPPRKRGRDGSMRNGRNGGSGRRLWKIGTSCDCRCYTRNRHRQKSLNRVGESSVYRTVCWMER